MITQINPAADVVTLINSFTVEPERQHELIALLIDATEQVMRHQPGFVSANIHAGLDGTRVANYAQWQSVPAFEAMLANPECRKHMAAAAEIATFDPVLYTVTAVHHA